MSLDSALNSAMSGLHVNQAEIYLATRNVTHAADKNYRRLDAEMGDDNHGNVTIKNIQVVMDEFLEKEVMEQNSVVGYTSTKEYFFDKINIIFGSPGLPEIRKENVIPKNINAAVEAFFSKVQVLAATPENYSLKMSVVNSANHLSSMLSNLAYNLHDLRFQADEMIGNSCYSVNQYLGELYDINLQLKLSSNDKKSQADFELRNVQTLQGLSEFFDVYTNIDSNNSLHVYTEEGKELFGNYPTEVLHQALPSVDMVISGQEFNPLLLVSGDYVTEIKPERLDFGKMKALVEIRDVDIPNILFSIDELAHLISREVNEIYSTGNNFPGHKELISQKGVSDMQFTGGVKLALMNEGGQAAGENGYIIRALDLDLGGKTLEEIADEINRHYFFNKSQVSIADYVDDVRLVSVSDFDQGFEFYVEFENAGYSSAINVQEISIVYGDKLKQVLFKDSVDCNISAGPYETVQTLKPFYVDLANMPTGIKEFIVRLKVNVNGSYADIDYNVNSRSVQELYSATEVKGDDCKVVRPFSRSYINAGLDRDGVFTIAASNGFRFAIEDLGSNSKYGNFFHALGCNNLFSEQRTIEGSAVNMKINDKLKKQAMMLNTAAISYNEKNLHSVNIGENTILKKIMDLENKKIKIFDVEVGSSISYLSTKIIERVAFQVNQVKLLNDYEMAFYEVLDSQQKSISGVNVDEEITKTIMLKNIHEASANLIKTIEETFYEMLDLI